MKVEDFSIKELKFLRKQLATDLSVIDKEISILQMKASKIEDNYNKIDRQYFILTKGITQCAEKKAPKRTRQAKGLTREQSKIQDDFEESLKKLSKEKQAYVVDQLGLKGFIL